MARKDLENILDGFGDKASEAIDKIEKIVDEEKSQLDTETRRKTRAFWLPVGFLLGVVATVIVQWFV